MSLPRVALAVIGDEIGPSLSEMISFCGENDVHRLDMRTVEGKNLLGMTLGEVDSGNSWSMGMPPSDDEIAALAPLVDLIHLKDRDFKARRTVPLGDGGVPWAHELKRLLAGVRGPEVVASMETHCPQDGRQATAKSVAALRRIAGEIGVEIV